MGLFSRKPVETPSVVLLTMGDKDLATRPAHTLGPGEDVIGRDEDCTIQLLDAKVSRHHASIAFQTDKGGFVVLDMGSANGTRLNGASLDEPTLLQEGDVIDLGGSKLLYTTDPASFLDITAGKRIGERSVRTQVEDVPE